MIVVIQAFPMGSELLQAILVDVAEPVAKTNQPEPSIFLLSPLAIGSEALLSSPASYLLIQIWQGPLIGALTH